MGAVSGRASGLLFGVRPRRPVAMAAVPSGEMKPMSVRKSKKVHPTGDPNFTVSQCFPAGFTAEESDPFLMCDHFGPKPSTGRVSDPDSFMVGWHPHRGMDICTYMKEGVGRHADSLGNRGEYATPGMQWISVGSGIEHAEGGGTPKGQNDCGFQIWINVPADRKMDDPRYGTVPPEDLPVLAAEGLHARVLAGAVGGASGPFQTVQPLQMVDYALGPAASHTHVVPAELDNCLVYVYQGHGSVCGMPVPLQSIVRVDATDASARTVTLAAGPEGMSAMLFAGKRLRQPIAWQGPFVMNSDAELRQAMSECRSGAFPPIRAPWDYKRLAAFPKDKLPAH